MPQNSVDSKLSSGGKGIGSTHGYPGNYMTANWSNVLLHIFDEWLPGKVEQLEAELEALCWQWRDSWYARVLKHHWFLVNPIPDPSQDHQILQKGIFIYEKLSVVVKMFSKNCNCNGTISKFCWNHSKSYISAMALFHIQIQVVLWDPVTFHPNFEEKSARYVARGHLCHKHIHHEISSKSKWNDTKFLFNVCIWCHLCLLAHSRWIHLSQKYQEYSKLHWSHLCLCTSTTNAFWNREYPDSSKTKLCSQGHLCLSTFTMNTSCQLYVLWHYGNSLGVYSAEVCVFKEVHQVVFCCLLKCCNHISSEV